MGTTKAVEDEAKRFSLITDIMVKGRQEMQKHSGFINLNPIILSLQ